MSSSGLSLFLTCSSRIRDGDPNFYTNRSPGILTESEVAELRNVSLGNLITRNTEIENLPENPFFRVSRPIREEDKTSTITFSDSLQMNTRYFPGNETIEFEVTSYYTKWFGIGLGEKMNDLDIFLFRNVDGVWNVRNAYRYEFCPPFFT